MMKSREWKIMSREGENENSVSEQAEPYSRCQCL